MNNKMKEFYKVLNESYDILYVTGKDYYEEFSKNKFSENVHCFYVEKI